MFDWLLIIVVGVTDVVLGLLGRFARLVILGGCAFVLATIFGPAVASWNWAEVLEVLPYLGGFAAFGLAVLVVGFGMIWGVQRVLYGLWMGFGLLCYLPEYLFNLVARRFQQ
jgi:hypothetical protein